MRIKLYNFLTEEQQDEIQKIISKLKDRIKKKEISYNEAFMEIKHGKEVRNWLSRIEDIENFYGSFIPLIQKRLLKGYQKIFGKLIKRGVLIASNAGTQLGIVREGNLINWDEDLDLVIDIKDFNKYKWHLRIKSIFNGWIPWTRNWIKDDFSTYNDKRNLQVQFASLKRLKLDLGKVTISFFPFIDLFPAIRINSEISRENIENISLSLVSYYDKCVSNESARLIKNKKIVNGAPNFYKKLVNLEKVNLTNDEVKSKFSKSLQDNYSENSKVLLQLHVMNTLFSLYDYSTHKVKSINVNGDVYSFIITDNFEEQLSKEYGEDWRKPKRTHSHFIMIWFAKLKKKR